MNELSWAILFLTLAAGAQLVEEIVGRIGARLPPSRAPRMLFIGVNILFFLSCAVAIALSTQKQVLSVAFGWVLAGVMTIDGLAHIGSFVVRGKYFPGGIAAFPIMLTASHLLLVLVHSRFAEVW